MGVKEVAARILGVGVNRVRLDPNNLDKIADAITAGAVRALIKEGIIWAEKPKGVSKGRHRAKVKKRRLRGRGSGSKKGKKGARMGKKERWVLKVRSLRHHLKVMKDRGEISKELYWELYRQVKGGHVRSVKHLKELVSQRLGV